MLTVGLTGGIGAGKSSAAAAFRELGLPTLDLDEVSREVVAPGGTALPHVIEQFGNEFLRSDGSLDRSALGRLVFSNPAARNRLESILHPEIRRRWQEWLRELRESDHPPASAIVEIPLLFESNLQNTVDRIVLVTAPGEVRVARLVSRGLTPEEALSRMDSQMSEDVKRLGSHYVIANDSDQETLRRRVSQVVNSLLNEASREPIQGR